MSKVVHLSDEAHQRAKIHCRDENLKMSEWVADLIAGATASQGKLSNHFTPSRSTPQGHSRSQLPARHSSFTTNTSQSSHMVGNQVATVEKKMAQPDVQSSCNLDAADSASVYAAPPFWAQSGTSGP